MPYRIVKHVGARSTPADDAKLLFVVPMGPGELVTSVKLSAYCASGASSSIDQPGEINWYGVGLPWSLVFARELLSKEAVTTMSTVVQWDALFEAMVRASTPGTADVYWGGDVDVDPDVGSEEESVDPSQSLFESGPIGIHRWFEREVLMRPFAAEGNNVIRFGDEFEAQLSRAPASKAQGGVMMFGVMRSEVTAETNFNVELDDNTSEEAMGLLIAGDYKRIEARIQGDTGAVGDFLRTVLFGGDHYVEADTLKGPAAKCAVKAVIGIDTAISKWQ